MIASPSPQNTENNNFPIFHKLHWVKKAVYLLSFVIIAIIGYRTLKPLFFKHTTTIHAFVQPVAVATAQKTNVPIVLTELGTVVPLTNITVQTRVSGYLLNVYFTEGQKVNKNDLLALIDPRPYEALKAQYEGTLIADTALLKQARLDNARYQVLVRQKSVAPMIAQDQQYKVSQLEGQIKVDKALIRQQELNVMYCQIRALTDGRIGIRQVDPGNYITEGQSGGLAVLTQMEPISVIFTIPENDLAVVSAQMNKHQSLSVEAWNSDNTKKLASGKASIIDSQIDTSTGTVRLRAVFPNKNWELFPNQFVNARLLTQILRDVIRIPNNAIQTGPNGPFVYVVQQNHTVKVRTIKTGYNDGENTVVESGLQAGEKVVTDGIDQLRDGSNISIPAEQERPSIHGNRKRKPN